MSITMNRRAFVCGTVAVAGVAATAGMALADEAAGEAAVDYASQVTEIRSCDIVVVGAGMSGLAAGVEALNGGADVLVLESEAVPGGNGRITSNVLAVGSSLQQDLGIE